MKKILIAVSLMVMLQGCAAETPTLKSPCVGAVGSPCGDRIPVNEKWLSERNIKS